MKVTVIGAGAIGSVVAGLLAGAGAQVNVVERGSRREVIARDGLRYRLGDQPLAQASVHLADAADLPVQDVVFLAVKSHVLPVVLADIGGLLGAHTRVVPLVNGVPWWYFHGQAGATVRHVETVDPGARALQALAPSHLVGSVVYITAALAADGVAHATGPQRLVIGDVLGGITAHTRALGQRLDAAGITTRLSEDIRSDLWTKVALNLATNPLSVVSESHLDAQFNRPDLRASVDAVLCEAIGLAQHYGVQPSMPFDDMIATGQRVGAFATSMLQDYRAGRPLELAAIGYAVLELAEQAGHAMPVARSIVGLAAYKSERALAALRGAA
ncbi:MAG: 2-dehydropantoate 2-reductase [Pseudoxanthomonas sp.]